MGSQKNKILLEKYWEGLTNVEEEALLNQQFADKQEVGEAEGKYSVIFEYKKALQDEAGEDFDLSFMDDEVGVLPTPVRLLSLPGKKAIRRWTVGLAASALIAFFSLSYQWPRTQTLEAKSQEMERAYTETLAALQMVADKLNQGNASIHEISVFDKTTKQIIHEKSN